MTDFDVIIVGGGIAGASLGAEIAGRRRSLIIEAEGQCGYHSTGRSAAFYLESYGGPDVAKLSRASHDFLAAPEAEFSDRSFLRTRGDVHLTRGPIPALPLGIEARVVERAELERWIPGLRPEWRRGLFEPNCADIDVAALHAAYLRRFRKLGGTVKIDTSLQRAILADGTWTVRIGDGSVITTSILVNAAGAWTDPVAVSCGVGPIGIKPFRRTMVQLRVGRTGLRDLPLVDDADGTFYFKGEGDQSIWLSPHDEIRPTHATPRLTRSMSRRRSIAFSKWSIGRCSGSSAAGRAFEASRLTGFRSTASTLESPASSGVPGRVASESRRRPPPP